MNVLQTKIMISDQGNDITLYTPKAINTAISAELITRFDNESHNYTREDHTLKIN